MPTRAEMIAALQAQDASAAPAAPAPGGAPSRAQMIAALQAQDAAQVPHSPEDDMGMGERAVRAVGQFVAPVLAPIGRAVDSVTGAPVRAAISAAQDGTNPASAFMNQFGGDPENAPTGKEIAQKAGLGERTLSDVLPALYAKDGKGWALRKGGMLDPTASGAAGAAIDVAADPLNVVGVGEVADVGKALAKGAGSAAAKTVEGAAKVADLATGTKAATGALDAVKSVGKTTGKVASAAKDSVSELFKPSLAADAKEMAQIADKHGIPRDLISPAHEFGDTSIVTRLQRSIAEGSLGEKHLKAHNAGLEATTEAFEKNVVNKFGAPPATAEEAGKMIKDAVDKHVAQVFDDADITYQSAPKALGGPLKLDEEGLAALKSKAVGMKDEAIRLMRTSADPVAKSQAQNLMDWSDLILNKAEKGGSYKELADIVQNVGKAAYTKTPLGQIPSDMKKLRELYDTGSEALIQTVRNHSAEAADRLVANNMDIKAMLGDKSTLGRAISDASLSPEQIYNSLVKNGGSKQIEVLKRILPEDTFNAIRSKFLGDHVKYHADLPVVKFGETLRNLQKPNVAEKLGYMFKPEELSDAADLLKFGDRYGSPVLSSSGTGGSLGIKDIGKKVVGAVADEQTLETLKNRARAGANASAAGTGGASGAAPSAAASSAPAARRPLLRDRGPMETRAKVAQSAAPQTYFRPTLPGKSSASDDSQDSVDAQKPGNPDKWAREGLEKLKAHGRDPASIDSMRDAIMGDPKGKQMLINASDLKPGSKALGLILEKLKERYAARP